MAWFLPRDIIPRFGFPLSIGSDNGPAFVPELPQLVCKETTFSVEATKLHNGWENEPDYQGDFGKMDAQNWHPLDGHAAMSVNEGQDDPLVTWVFPLWDNIWEASPSYLGSKGKFITKRRDGGVSQQLEQLGKVIFDITLYVKKEFHFP